jgi:hypothetical protein
VGQIGVLMSWWPRVQRGAMVGAGLWCVVLGVGVTAALVDSGSLARAGTVTLLGAVGMLVLPGLTLVALRVDGRERRRMQAVQPEPDRVAHPAHPHDGARREPPAHRVRGIGVSRTADRAG